MEQFKTLRTVGAAALVALALASCDNSSPKMDDKPAGQPAASTSMKIAYVEVDSLMSQYDFCKDYTLVLQKKSNNARNTLNSKGKQLQNAVANFQEKLQNNGFTSRDEAQRVQNNLQRQEQDLQELQARLASELDTETAKYNKALRDSLQSFLDDYNKERSYDLIISKAGDNILYANKQFDITDDVIKGLNKRYKSKLDENGKEKK